jgi:hypothetical protein
MLESYKEFRLQSLFFQLLSISEAYIECASDLIFRLRSIKRSGGKSGEIAEILLNAIGETEVGKLTQNYFDLSDSDDKLTFISTNRIPWDDWDEDENPSLPYELSSRSDLKVGRAVRYMLNLLGESVTDKDLEDFVNVFKASDDKSELEFKLVKGEDIAKYYKEENYFSKHHGTLGNSCMKEEGKKTFKIYTENPKKVKLLILIDKDEKIHGRALVWKLKESPSDTKYLMDRVYTNKDSDVIKFKKFADENDWMYKKFNTSYTNQGVQFIYKGVDVNGVLTVKLDGDFNSYPYIDTMSFLSKEKNELSNVSSKRCYELKSVYGDRDRCSVCDGDIIIHEYGNKEVLCYDCSTGHKKLKELGIETKWNKKV